MKEKRMRLLALVVGVLYFSSLNGQAIEVLDRETNAPVSFVTITQVESNDYAITDDDGIADISELDSSKNLIFYIIGYKTDTLSWATIIESNFKVGLLAERYLIESVLVSSPRWRQSNGSTPARIAKISKQDIALQNPQTAADLLGKSGEVFIQKSQQGGGSPMIRGFSANRLLYSIDGVRMNTAIFRSGNLQNVISLDPFSIERTDVLYGPGSVSYGSDAIGGVMSFSTITPDCSANKFNGRASVRYNTANQERTAHLDLSYGNSKWSALTSATLNRYSDLKMGDKNGPASYLNTVFVQRFEDEDLVQINDNPLVQKNTGFDQLHLMQKLRYQPNSYLDLQFGLHYSTTSNYGRYDRLIRTQNGLPRSAEWYYGPQKWMMANAQLFNSKKTSAYDRTITRIAYQIFEESRHDRDLQALDLRSRMERVDAVSVNMDFIKTVDEAFEISYGLEGVYNRVNSSGKVTNIQTQSTNKINPRYPTSDWFSAASFVNGSYAFSPVLGLHAGARLNYYSLYSVYDTELFPLPFEEKKISNLGYSGSIGLVYKPYETWFLSANFSTGFRAPNVDDAGKIFDSEPGSIVVPNQNLTSENALNFEVTLSNIILDRIRLDLTGFYTILNDGMVRRNFRFNGLDSILYDGVLSQVQATINASLIRVRGIQAGAEWQLPHSMTLYGRVNIQSGDEELDDGTISPTRHASPLYGLVRITKKWKRIKAEVNTQFSGGYTFAQLPITEANKPFLYAQDRNGNPYSPKWMTINASLHYMLSKKVNASILVENILDKRYRTYSSGLTASGRSLMVSLSASF